MLLKTLVENTSISKEYGCEHGLSLYLETKKHKLLFDVGASDLLIENALKMNVDLAAVDLVVISHGHYDHGGGLKSFLQINSKAKIYIRPTALDDYYAKRSANKIAYIGLEKNLKEEKRLFFAGENMLIDEELQLFSNVTGTKLLPSGNADLFMEKGAGLVPDDFSHEQNLIIRENGNILLLAGCAHRGIVNILEHMVAMYGSPDVVVGGYHLYNRSADSSEDPVTVNQLGEYLRNAGMKLYTCHCTGLEPYHLLKEMIGEQINYLSTGESVCI